MRTITQEERLANSAYLVARLYLPHAIFVMLHVRKMYIVITTSETVGSISVCAADHPCR